ncbi:MAG: site-2 protease family protein [Parcubacteria group bacterium]|nr:site-2 protease family protein [Parcubacteria group bacterium]MCR4343101.1 site-2 protease family protein [Patescibacteria group bacterium]
MQADFIFVIAILIMSVVIHEVSHGYVAGMLGDPTAKLAGRLTLNPLKHLDFMGSIVVPTVTFLLGGIIFGWAKPVPYNPYNLKNQKWGPALVGLAGPFSNISVALFFGILIRLNAGFLSLAFIEIAGYVVFINLILAIFNLIPIPPLDGSKVLFALIPYKYSYIQAKMEKYGLILLIFFIFFLFSFMFPVISILFQIITGFSL